MSKGYEMQMGAHAPRVLPTKAVQEAVDAAFGPATPPAPPAQLSLLDPLDEAVVANLETATARHEAPPDMVNLPPHYARFAIEPMHFAEANKLSPLQFNVLKYTMRYDAKNGLEDLRKARRCLDMLIAKTEGNPDWWRASSSPPRKAP